MDEPTEARMTPDPAVHRESATFSPQTIAEIQRAASEGIYEIRGWGAKRQIPSFDDLLLLGASLSRYPLEGYRERCDTNVTLGTRYAKHPDRAQDSRHHRRHELRVAQRQREGGAGPGRHRDGHQHHHGRRRHDRRGTHRRRRRWSIRSCRRATGSIPTTSGEPTPLRSSWARAPSRAAAACCSASR